MSRRKTRDWRTRRDFEKDLFESYRSSKLQEAEPMIPMGAALIAYQAKRHEINLPKKVATALSVLDDLILDAILWHHTFSILLWNRNPALGDTLERSLLALHMKITQDAMVVRNLMNAGFDVQAKNLLRSIDEHTSAIYYLCLRPETAVEFVDTKDEKAANRFWWKHIRRSQKIIDDAIGKIVKNESALKKLSEFKLAERQLLSAVHHPSYVASTIPFMIPYGSTNVTMHMFGLPSEHSYRTGKLLFYILAEAALYVGLLNNDIQKIIDADSEDPLQVITKCGRQHLGIMAVHLANNWKSPLFGLSREMEKFFQSLPKDDQIEF